MRRRQRSVGGRESASRERVGVREGGGGGKGEKKLISGVCCW